jgi:gentisate 1,2-dioxygenase
MKRKNEVRKEGGIFCIFKGDTKIKKSTSLEDTGHLTKGLKGNFVMTPRIGPKEIGMTSAIHRPGDSMKPHVHEYSSDTLIIFEGDGEVYLKDKWISVKEGDVIYAPAGIKHGTRNPKTNNKNFIVIGVGTPPQKDLYARAKYDLNGSDEDYFMKSNISD